MRNYSLVIFHQQSVKEQLINATMWQQQITGGGAIQFLFLVGKKRLKKNEEN